ncbi:hypothetical protein BDFG_09332 [Blastomyces dermatitidis ATCC 26199]|nr:hypothetical protein BDFG_09332 [Blastomyces dermatitidis ATCC 26199]
MAVGGAGDELDMDKLISRRDDTSLQGMVTTAAAAKEAGEEEDVTMRAVLPWLIDAAASVFNLAFLAAMKAATTPQRHLLLTRKCQNKSLIVLQEQYSHALTVVIERRERKMFHREKNLFEKSCHYC